MGILIVIAIAVIMLIIAFLSYKVIKLSNEILVLQYSAEFAKNRLSNLDLLSESNQKRICNLEDATANIAPVCNYETLRTLCLERIKNGDTRKQVSEDFGVPESTISGWLSKK